MKFFVFAILAAVAITAHALSDEEKEKFKEFAGQCLESTGVEKDLIGKARAHEYTGRDPKLAHYYSCMLGKMHFQKDDGTFDTEVMIEKLPGHADHDSGSKAVKKCAVYDAAVSKDENSMNFMYCFYKAVGKDFKLF